MMISDDYDDKPSFIFESQSQQHDPYLDTEDIHHFQEFYSEKFRFLAGGGDGAKLDYSVVSVGVMTLGMLLFVEVIRHQLDHSAIGRPLFKTVLEGVYSELATLGIVELMIFLLHKYYKDLNIARELVFANVHFTLFYTAIFNAFQSVLLAICAIRVSNRLWVRTENLDLDHYVEIREEFDRISMKLYNRQFQSSRHAAPEATSQPHDAPGQNTTDSSDGRRPPSPTSSSSSPKHRTASQSFKKRSPEFNSADGAPSSSSSSSSSWFSRWLQEVIFTVLKPHLTGKYMELLIQVRFHQLRLHFLESNNLPLHFKVSDYLKKSERSVLQHLVHVSTFAWLFLTGGLNLIYFLMGMVAYITEDDRKVGASMTWIFVSSMILFIVGSLFVYEKMNRIFRLIINMKPSDLNDKESQKSGVEAQLKLFWAHDPNLVIAIIQFMQFGYALALAIILIFWDELHGSLDPGWYLVAVVVCYTIFLYVMAQVIPQYTLCTSLGYLVNQKHLQESLARCRLDDAQRKQKRKLIEYNNMKYYGDSYEGDSVLIVGPAEDDMLSVGATSTDMSSSVHSSSTKDVSTAGSSILSGRKNPGRLMAHGSGSTTSTTTLSVLAIPDQTAGPREAMGSSKAERLLMTIPAHESQDILNAREQRRLARHRRKKSASDGVAMMRSLNSATSGFHVTPQRPSLFSDAPSSSPANSALLAELVKADTQALRGVLPQESRDVLTSREQRLKERRMKRKSMTVSDGVAMMRTMRGTPTNTGGNSNPKSAASNTRFGRRSKTLNNDDVIRPVRSHDDSDVPNLRQLDRRTRRLHRQKAVSASELIQSWRDFSITDVPATQSQAQETQQLHLTSQATAQRASRGGRSTSSGDKRTGSPTDPPIGQGVQLSDPIIGDISKTRIVDFIPPQKSSMAGDDTKETGSGKVVDDDMGSDKSIGALSAVDDEDILPGFIATPNIVEKISPYVPPVPFASKVAKFISPWFDKKEWKEYFLSSRYSTASHVFGTLVCFFLVGHRVEGLLTASHVIYKSDNTWNFDIFISFWFQTTMYILFLMMDLAILALFHPEWWRQARQANDSSTKHHRNQLLHEVIILSAAIDILIVGICICVLFVAEWQRCCGDGEENTQGYKKDDIFHRGVYAEKASKYENGDDHYGDDNYGNDSDYSTVDFNCCGRYGDRTSGGLGNIEPFTALVAIRIFRFVAARSLSSYLTRINYNDGSTTDAVLNEGISTKSAHEETPDEASKVFGSIFHGPGAAAAHGKHGEKDGKHDQKHGMKEETGTALELWEIAIGKHPDIVAKYGEFSSELFQAMLGLQLVETLIKNDVATEPWDTYPNRAWNPDTVTFNDTVHATENREFLKRSQESTRHISLTGEQYANLPPEAQGIIIAGKLGKPVKSMSNLASLDGANLPTLNEYHEEDEDHTHVIDAKPSTRLPPYLTSSGLHRTHGTMEFIVDDDQIELEAIDEQDMFIAPNARLLRCMRRCDRRLLPLLNKWVTVDVAITQFEMVYFEAADDDDHDATQSTVLALKATKGGKGLRLCDVARGRAIAGHLDLSDVTEIHVERSGPLTEPGDHGGHGDVENAWNDLGNDDGDNEEMLYSEYWMRPVGNQDFGMAANSSSRQGAQAKKSSRNRRWNKVTEDRLKLVSLAGTLVLRFYSDLDDAEANIARSFNEKDLESRLTRNIALQWAQTIGRSCGREQLQQVLSHFGDGTCDELRDYLQMVPFHQREFEREGHNYHHLHRRNISGNLHDLAKSAAAPTVSASIRRLSSMAGSNITDDGDSKPVNRKKLFSSRSFGASRELSPNPPPSRPQTIQGAAVTTSDSDAARPRGSEGIGVDHVPVSQERSGLEEASETVTA